MGECMSEEKEKSESATRSSVIPPRTQREVDACQLLRSARAECAHIAANVKRQQLQIPTSTHRLIHQTQQMTSGVPNIIANQKTKKTISASDSWR